MGRSCWKALCLHPIRHGAGAVRRWSLFERWRFLVSPQKDTWKRSWLAHWQEDGDEGRSAGSFLYPQMVGKDYLLSVSHIWVQFQGGAW